MYTGNKANLNISSDAHKMQGVVSQWAMKQADDDNVDDGDAAATGENMNQDAYNQYRQSSYDQVPEPGNPTYTEAWALVEAARRMALPLEHGDWDSEENNIRVRDSLRLNWRLWTVFQTELSLEDGHVPAEIRESMLSLCNFVDKHTVDTINDPTPEKIATLIEINRNIANGLLTSLNNALDSEEAAQQSPDEADAPQEQAPTSVNTDA